MAETRPSIELKPSTPMSEDRFDWSSYLQRHLTSPGVVVSRLHPIMGLRLACLMIELTHSALASDNPGQGRFQILSGVRTKAQQIALYNDICLRQRRCAFVANPYRVHSTDAEGVQRQGSNHMAQMQPTTGEEWGYAVDFRNTSGSTSEAWKPLHARLRTYGLDWPLKSGAVERWHVEWFPRSGPGPLDGPIAWPRRPGVHRTLVRGSRGGDVESLQRIVSADPFDGIFGTGTEQAVKARQSDLGLTVTGRWDTASQTAHEADVAPPPPPAPGPVIPPTAAARALVVAAQAKLEKVQGDLDAALDFLD